MGSKDLKGMNAKLYLNGEFMSDATITKGLVYTPERDRRGTELLVGAKVCYNQSGEVGYGEIVDIRKTTRYGKDHLTYYVKNLDNSPSHYKLDDKPSKVSNNHNLMVINES